MRISDLSSDVCSSDLATHSNDYLAFHPIFCEGRLVAFSGLMVHHLDIGAMNMGTRGWNTEIFQEGVRIPPMKLIEEGRLDQKVMSIILTNTRTPDIHENDVTSQDRKSTRLNSSH